MSDELNEPQEEVLEAETATAEPEESTTDTEAQPAEKPKLNGYEKRISTLTHRNYAKDQEIAQLKAELETRKATDKQPDSPVPAYPDDDLRYDNPQEYRKQLDAYIDHKAAAQYQSQQRAYQEAESNRKAEEQRAKLQSEQQEIVGKYIENGLASGISEEKMIANEAMLKSVNIDQGLAQELYSDPEGAKLVDFLADNPDKLAQLAGMSPYQAAVQIATEIKPQALSSKPSSTNAPDPIEPTSGGAVPPADNLQWIRGATFE